MFQQKDIDNTWYEQLEIKLKEYLHMHHRNKRNRRKIKIKKNYLLHGRTLLIEGIFWGSKKFV